MKKYALYIFVIVNTVRLQAQTTSGSINSIVNNDTITYNGSSAQMIPAGTFTGNAIYNLAIANNAGVVNNGNLTISSSYTLSNLGPTTPLVTPGKKVTITGSSLIIKSFSGTPAAGASYTLLSADTLTGAFMSVILPADITGTITYPANTVVLTINSVPLVLLTTGDSAVSRIGSGVGAGTAFAVYPNPARNLLTIVYGKVETRSAITIYTLDGRQLLRKEVVAGAVQSTIDISDLLSGASYMVTFKNDNTIKTKIFIKE